MNRSSASPEHLLQPLLSELRVDTFHCSYASTRELRAVSTPHARGDGLSDLVVHIQPNQQVVPEAILGRKVQLMGSGTPLEATISPQGRIAFHGLPPGNYRLHPALQVVTSRLDFLTFLEASGSYNDFVATGLAAKTTSSVDIPSDDGEFGMLYEEQPNGDLRATLDSRHMELEGTLVSLYAGENEWTETLRKVATDQVAAEIVITRAERTSVHRDEVLRARLGN